MAISAIWLQAIQISHRTFAYKALMKCFQLKRNVFTARYETNLDTQFMITFFFTLCPWTAFQSPLSVSFHQRSTLICIYMLLLPEGQAGEVWEPSKKGKKKSQVLSEIGER